MTWTKLGDEFGPESGELTDGEFRTHVEALIYSNWRLLDLYVPKSEVRRFAGSADASADVEGLVKKNWWIDAGDAWYIGCRFPEWQLEGTVVEHRRAGSALRQRRHRMHKAGDHSLCLAENCRDTTRDVTRDTTRDPGRVGTGRDGSPKTEGQGQALTPAGEQRAGNEVDGQGSDSVAISEKHRDHDGPKPEVHDDQQIPADSSAVASLQTVTRATP